MILETLSLTNLGRFLVYGLTLSLLVLVHEWGHFSVARRYGVGIREFALGFGPSLLSRTSARTGTRYRFNLIPLGGYCAMIGEDEPAATESSSQVTGVPLCTINPWQRLAVVAAGPFVNIIAALAIMWVTAMCIGVPGKNVSTQIGHLSPGKPAQIAGLHEGDSITSINGKSIQDGTEMMQKIHISLGKKLVIGYRENGQIHFASMTPVALKYDGIHTQGIIGFTPVAIYEKLPPLKAFDNSAKTMWFITTSTFESVGLLIRGAPHAIDNLSGPVGMARAAVAIQSYGLPVYLSFVALLSLSLGIFNLFPLPALDGGRAIFVLVELIRGKAVDPEKEAFVHITGFAALIAFVLFVTYHDILHIIMGQAAF